MTIEKPKITVKRDEDVAVWYLNRVEVGTNANDVFQCILNELYICFTYVRYGNSDISRCFYHDDNKRRMQLASDIFHWMFNLEVEIWHSIAGMSENFEIAVNDEWNNVVDIDKIKHHIDDCWKEIHDKERENIWLED